MTSFDSQYFDPTTNNFHIGLSGSLKLSIFQQCNGEREYGTAPQQYQLLGCWCCYFFLGLSLRHLSRHRHAIQQHDELKVVVGCS